MSSDGESRNAVIRENANSADDGTGSTVEEVAEISRAGKSISPSKMPPPSDRELRVLKRSFDKVSKEIDELLSKNLDLDVFSQIEVLFDGSLKQYKDKFDQAAHGFYLLVDEKSKEDTELESKIVSDEANIRKVFTLLQASVRKAAAKVNGDTTRRSILPGGGANSTMFESKPSEQPKLKKIEIPEFDGDLSKFYNFKALFTNLVHSNPEFSNVQKLYYLKQSLVGKAAIVLQDCDLAEDAYPDAWSYFLSRFESKRAIVRTFFVKLNSLQPIKSENGIREMLDQVMAIIRGLKVAGEMVDDTFSRYISFIVSTKLDTATAKDWDNHTCAQSKYPKFNELFKFLQGRTFVIDERRVDRPKEVKDKDGKDNSKFFADKKRSFVATSSSKGSCPMCKSQHFLNQCGTFKALNPHKRFDFVKGNRLCLICFSNQHSASACTSNVKCRCGKPHHYLLHFEFNNSSETAEKNDSNAASKDDDGKDSVKKDGQNANQKKTYAATVMQRELEEELVVLPSAVVRFECGQATGTIRVLIDSCSQATLISDRFVKKFRLPTHTFGGSSIGGVTPGCVSPDSFVELSLISRTRVFSIDVAAEIVPPSSMDYQLHTVMGRQEFEKLSKFQLADPALAKKLIKITEVDMILGAKYTGRCMEAEKIMVNNLTLTLSKFGWLVSGDITHIEKRSKKFTGFTLKAIENELKQYHNVELAGVVGAEPQKATNRCVEHYDETYGFSSDGKFNLLLPFCVEKSKIANNRKLALKSLFRLEQKLDPALKVEYVKFMREYEKMGHMSLAAPTNDPCYMIPHRAVVREKSLTTPVRVVFNASSKSRGQISLNQGLLVGPQIQRELFDILISVRSFRYVVSADVEKMYRMIWIDEKDRDMQRILWRESPDEPIGEYRLNTVTYGTGPASFLATKCLEIIARKIAKDHPEAARLIRENFYMDDMIAGGNNLEQVCKNRQVIHDALLVHGFKLRKYCANHSRILLDIPAELVVNGSNVELAENISMLGIEWSPQDDVFCVKINLDLDGPSIVVTKRLMMSYLARTFDPLGVVAPVTLRGKLMIQSLWRAGLDWDVAVPQEMAFEFTSYLAELRELSKLNIDRYVCRPGTKIQLVGFCDASARAYCAVLFVRTIDGQEVKSCRLIVAKTRVAPTKEMTIPKLELSSALLLAQLMDRVRGNLNVNLEDCFLFTDATIVLCWLSQPPNQWKTFVSNRVEKIVDLVPYECWFYVHTSVNPADLATRGLGVSEFLQANEWFLGPSFLKNLPICSSPIPNFDVSTALERRKKQVFTVARAAVSDLFIDKFSDFSRLLRVLAYVLRFVDRSRKFKNDVLSAVELDVSLIFALRMVQRVYFCEDIDRLSNNLALKANSKLLPLTPFLDDRFVLRVGGRLDRSNLSESRKHPVILPAKAQFTRVLLRWAHKKYFHANRRFLLGYLASRYWIVGGCANLVKNVVHSCVRCTRFKSETASQLMGQLPPFRVNVSRPFSHTGVDLAGPFKCKCVAHRTTRFYKIYIAIFVCMVVKCVHIEVVTDLSSAKFVEALQRFIARRGTPSHMYSDNGTNFVGTKNLIVQNQECIQSFLASEGINWSMIPPRSPHFGGLWEAAVRSAKYHFARVNNGNVLSYDEYYTLITRVEAVLNSRPLCVSVNQGDDVLTPGHFLVGRSLTAPAVFENIDSSRSLSTRLHEVNTRLRSFWNVWKVDYLNQLQRRYKWQREKPNLQVGQVVLLKDESAPFDWPLAVVQEIYPDDQGVVRVVGVKTASSPHIFKRTIAKIITLPIDVTPEPLKGSVGGVCLERCNYFII